MISSKPKDDELRVERLSMPPRGDVVPAAVALAPREAGEFANSWDPREAC